MLSSRASEGNLDPGPARDARVWVELSVPSSLSKKNLSVRRSARAHTLTCLTKGIVAIFLKTYDQR